MTHPTGTVTFLFTDIEGSTKLAQEYPDAHDHTLMVSVTTSILPLPETLRPAQSHISTPE